MIPHDYYAPWSDEPRLHNRGEGRPYVEPDWQAHDAGRQLPALSTIGRGPKGDGLYIDNYQCDDLSFSFDIMSDRTGEVIEHIGPIPAGSVSVDAPQSTTYGEPTTITITTNKMQNGDVVRDHKEIEIPAGAPGSQIFIAEGAFEPEPALVYSMQTSILKNSNDSRDSRLSDAPLYREGDMVIFKTQEQSTNASASTVPNLCVGYISATNGTVAMVREMLTYPLGDAVVLPASNSLLVEFANFAIENNICYLYLNASMQDILDVMNAGGSVVFHTPAESPFPELVSFWPIEQEAWMSISFITEMPNSGLYVIYFNNNIYLTGDADDTSRLPYYELDLPGTK